MVARRGPQLMEAALRRAVRNSPLQMAHNRPILVIVEKDKANRRRKRVKVLAACLSNAAYCRLGALPSPFPPPKNKQPPCHFGLN
jgi:hypothetical protein